MIFIFLLSVSLLLCLSRFPFLSSSSPSHTSSPLSTIQTHCPRFITRGHCSTNSNTYIAPRLSPAIHHWTRPLCRHRQTTTFAPLPSLLSSRTSPDTPRRFATSILTWRQLTSLPFAQRTYSAFLSAALLTSEGAAGNAGSSKTLRPMDPHPTRSPRYHQSHLATKPVPFHTTYHRSASANTTDRLSASHFSTALMHSIDPKPIGEQQQQPLSSQQALPLPQQPNEQYQGSDMANLDTASVKSKESVDTAADVEQHCLLFPTYATRHSRSGMLFVNNVDVGEYVHTIVFFVGFFLG